MDVLILPVFVSICILAAGILFLLRSIRQGDYEHGDRLTLLPLDEEQLEELESAPIEPGRKDRLK